jgi:hypothetical protein
MTLGDKIIRLMMSIVLINMKTTLAICEFTMGKTFHEIIGDINLPILGSINIFDVCMSLMILFGYISLFTTIFSLVPHVPEIVEKFITKQNKLPNSVNLEKEEVINNPVNIDHDLFKKRNLEINFDNMELNSITHQILEKVKELKDNEIVKKDMEIWLVIENTKSEYLPRVFYDYIQIPKNRLGIKEDKQSPYSLTLNQLNIILNGLDAIEERIVKNNIMSQKANEIFLKEKMGSI